MAKFASWNLNALQAFVVVAEQGSFRKAAMEGGRSQPALSSQIKELETRLGVKLFHRTTRRVSLTPEGAELLDHARKAFSELSVGLTNAQQAADARTERVRFGCLPTLIPGIVPPAISRLKAAFPNVIVNAVELLNDDLVAAVRSQEVEFGIGVTVPASECEFEPICHDEMCALFALDGHREHVGEIVLAELISYPIILPRQSTPTLQALEREARRQQTALALRHQFSQPQSVASTAAAGHGVGILARFFVDSMNYQDVRVLRVIEPKIEREISLIVRSGVALSRPAQAFASNLKSILRDRISSGCR